MLDRLRKAFGMWSFRRYHAGVLRNIGKYGWTSVQLGGDDVYVHTVGFWEGLQAPDLVVSGIGGRYPSTLLWEMARLVHTGQVTIADGEPIPGSLPHGEFVCRAVHPSWSYRHWFPTALWYRERHTGVLGELPIFQLVAPDLQGRHPWHPDFDQTMPVKQHAFYEPCPS